MPSFSITNTGYVPIVVLLPDHPEPFTINQGETADVTLEPTETATVQRAPIVVVRSP